MEFPIIDPVAFWLGPVPIRWYALAYLAGLILGARYAVHLAGRYGGLATADQLYDFMVWACLGVILGGRIVYVVAYSEIDLGLDPLAVFRVWEGGMSFHGGFLGVVVAGLVFATRQGLPVLRFADLLACTAPIGLFLGRVANFINGELWGRPTSLPWGMVFPDPRAGFLPRHPSQLYQAALEGIVLLVVTRMLYAHPGVRERPGLVTAVFLVGYATARALVETVREPDAQLGLLPGGITMGQLLSAPMLIAGLCLCAYALSWRGSHILSTATVKSNPRNSPSQ